MAKATIRTSTDTPPAIAPREEGRTAAGSQGRAVERNVAGAAGHAFAAPRAKINKLDQIRALLAGPEGASLARLCSATGWQAHSVRAAPTGLRKSGAALTKGKGAGGVTVYRLGSDGTTSQ